MWLQNLLLLYDTHIRVFYILNNWDREFIINSLYFSFAKNMRHVFNREIICLKIIFFFQAIISLLIFFKIKKLFSKVAHASIRGVHAWMMRKSTMRGENL